MTAILYITEQVTHCFACSDKERAEAIAEGLVEGTDEPDDFPSEYIPLKGEARFMGSYILENEQ